MTNPEYLLYGIFILTISVFLLLDLGVFNRAPKPITTKSALRQSIFWVSVSLIFGFLILLFLDNGEATALQYFSAYLTEYALSVDNIFVILLILKFFTVREELYHKILFWGILGAVIFRGIFIFLGLYLVAHFHWILYLFGAFLIYSGVKIFSGNGDETVDPSENTVLKFCKKYLPITSDDTKGSFVVRESGKFLFTPVFLVLLLIETTDLIFAVDSIPAAFAISQNEFVIFTSNIFAVLGLRAMFFLLSGIINRFYLLQKGLSVILVFVGAKMLLELADGYLPEQLTNIGPGISFVVIILTLTISILFSVIIPEMREDQKPKS